MEGLDLLLLVVQPVLVFDLDIDSVEVVYGLGGLLGVAPLGLPQRHFQLVNRVQLAVLGFVFHRLDALVVEGTLVETHVGHALHFDVFLVPRSIQYSVELLSSGLKESLVGLFLI